VRCHDDDSEPWVLLSLSQLPPNVEADMKAPAALEATAGPAADGPFVKDRKAAAAAAPAAPDLGR